MSATDSEKLQDSFVPSLLPINSLTNADKSSINAKAPHKDALSITAATATTVLPQPKYSAKVSEEISDRTQHRHDSSNITPYSSLCSSHSAPSAPLPIQSTVLSSDYDQRHSPVPVLLSTSEQDTPTSSQEVDIFMLAAADATKRRERGERPLFESRSPSPQVIQCVGCGETETGDAPGVADDTIQCYRCKIWSHTACIKLQFGTSLDDVNTENHWICKRCRGARIWDTSL